MKRVWALDVLESPRCHGRLRILAAIHSPDAIGKMPWFAVACSSGFTVYARIRRSHPTILKASVRENATGSVCSHRADIVLNPPCVISTA